MERLTRYVACVVTAVYSSAAFAATGGPPIAYALSSASNSFDLYVSNPDGTGKAKLYSSGRKVNIVQVDMKPGGNELALIEYSIAGGYVLKIVTYTDAGSTTSVTPVDNSGCQILGVDYSPVDGSLLASRYCNNNTTIEARRYVDGPGYDSNPIVTMSLSSSKAGGYIRWLGDGSGFLWAIADTSAGGGTIERHMMSNPYAPVVVYKTGSASLPAFFDVARCGGALDASCSKILVTNNTGQIHLVTFDSFGGTDQGIVYSSAEDGHFSPDNAHVLWRREGSHSYQLMIDNQVFVGNGGFGGRDWRQ